MHLLYLEDNTNDANLINRYINTTEHQLVIVPNSDDAWTAFQEHHFDIILVDVMLGSRREGLEFAKELRGSNYLGPLIGVTALTTPQDMERYRQTGFDFVLAKPFTIVEFANLLERYVS